MLSYCSESWFIRFYAPKLTKLVYLNIPSMITRNAIILLIQQRDFGFRQMTRNPKSVSEFLTGKTVIGRFSGIFLGILHSTHAGFCVCRERYFRQGRVEGGDTFGVRRANRKIRARLLHDMGPFLIPGF